MRHISKWKPNVRDDYTTSKSPTLAGAHTSLMDHHGCRPDPRPAAAGSPGPASRNLQKDAAYLPSVRTYGKPMEKLWKIHVWGRLGGMTKKRLSVSILHEGAQASLAALGVGGQPPTPGRRWP